MATRIAEQLLLFDSIIKWVFPVDNILLFHINQLFYRNENIYGHGDTSTTLGRKCLRKFFS